MVPGIWSSLGTRDAWGIPGGLDGGAGLLLGLWLGCRVGPSSLAAVVFLDGLRPSFRSWGTAGSSYIAILDVDLWQIITAKLVFGVEDVGNSFLGYLYCFSDLSA